MTLARIDQQLAFLVSPLYIGWACTKCAWAYPAGLEVRPVQMLDMQREFKGHWCGDFDVWSKMDDRAGVSARRRATFVELEPSGGK